MKKIFVIFTIIMASLLNFSCSGSQEGSDESAPAGEDFFKAYNGDQPKYFTKWEAVKRGDVIEVSGTSVDGFSINIKLNMSGELYDMTTNFNNETYSESYYYSAGSLTNLSIVYPKSKLIRVYCSGKLWKDSDWVGVGADMQLHYTTETPAEANLGTTAKLNNVIWHGTATGSKPFTETATVLEVQNEKEYIIGIVHPDTNPAVGTYTFSGDDFSNGISFTKFDKNYNQLIHYNVSGTIKYTKVNNDYVQGTFTLTATHPTIGNTIAITNGVFKEMLH